MSMRKFKMLPLFNGRITLYQDFGSIGLSFVVSGENKFFDNGMMLHIQILFWEIEIYSFKESEAKK
jgi:hypothetical protein